MIDKVKNVITYEKGSTDYIAYPMGGLGSGMICLEGSGRLSSFSIKHKPDVHNEPNIFSALRVKTKDKSYAKVLEGSVPRYKVFGEAKDTGNGLTGKNYGLARFTNNTFQSAFPFARIDLTDSLMPVEVTITGFSPFIPSNEDDSGLPAISVFYRFKSTSESDLKLIYSVNCENIMKNKDDGMIEKQEGKIIFGNSLSENFLIRVQKEKTYEDINWYEGSWFDTLSLLWRNIESGNIPSMDMKTSYGPGASIYVPFDLKPGEEKEIRIDLLWYVPKSALCYSNTSCCNKGHVPWYAVRFKDILELEKYYVDNFERMYTDSGKFTSSFYNSNLPSEIIEAVAANLSILKSPTILRQADGRLWTFEGCCDSEGCCFGSCTHVLNYAQAICHLFPGLERTLRKTEFNESQNEEGHQQFRSSLPTGASPHDFHAAADGQFGGIMKVYRDYTISGDIKWLKQIWPKVKKSCEYLIRTFDPDMTGHLTRMHHNTYDIEFYGPDSMCCSIYTGAMYAAAKIAELLSDEIGSRYMDLYEKGRIFLEEELFNGEYFIQKISGEVENEKYMSPYGIKYQYMTGCLSDGIIGDWFANVCSIGTILSKEKVISHLLSIYKYNLKEDLSHHSNPQRPGFALGDEGGLLLCTWPGNDRPAFPFVYSDEVWTGIEYQVASHLILYGCIEEGLKIIRILRKRYDAKKRNPFNEYECGHWYMRALASYSLIYAYSGIRYDAAEKIIYMDLPENTGDFSSFLSWETGFGTAGIKEGVPFVNAAYGHIDYINIIRSEKSNG